MTHADRAFDLAMNAPPPRRVASPEVLQMLRERLPKNDAGECVCPTCTEILPDEVAECEPCVLKARREHQRKGWIARVRQDWEHSSGWSRSSLDAPPWQLPRWDWARLDNEAFRKLVSPKLLRAVEKWDPSMGPLALCADTGAGKTALLVAKAVALYKRALAQAEAVEEPSLFSFRFVSALELVAARRTHRLGHEEPRLVNEALTTRATLILDELGFEDMREPLILEIADARYKLKAPTLLTTGRTPEAFAARYGAAVWRRFTERGHVVADFTKAKGEPCGQH